MADRVEELAARIERYQKSYYNGEPEISDVEFDLLWDELKRLQPAHPLLSAVGSDSSAALNKRRHLIPMGSQEKAADPQAFRKWADGVAHEEYLVQLKLDGASLELQFDSGLFTCAITRGDGLIGDDITANAKQMSGFVARISEPFTGGIRGEVLLTRAMHQARHADKANPRNAANGIMKRKDGRGSSDLTIVCYDAIEVTNDAFFGREEDKLEWLKEQGFCTVDYKVFTDVDQIIDYREQISRKRESLPFDIDGLVVKGQEIDIDDASRARPEQQIAFKFELEEAASTLRSVEWSPSGATYTPIAQIDPVRLAGTTVQRASLANPRLIREMGLQIGSRVAVSKRGEIIPKIERLLENPPDTHPVEYPTVCEQCKTPLVDEDTRLYCPNEACPKRSLYRIRRWLDVLDVRDFGDVILTKLFESNRVQEIADLYTLQPEDLTAFDRMGERLAGKILWNLYTPRELSLGKFVAGFNIEGVGELIVEKAVVAGYDTLEKLRAATPQELALVNGIGEITGAVIARGLGELSGRMDAVLVTRYVSIASPTSGRLSGSSFCFTGTLRSMPRTQAQELVRGLGGRVTGNVTRDLTFLITNDPASGSSKNRKAAEYGVQVLSEEAFLDLVEPVRGD